MSMFANGVSVCGSRHAIDQDSMDFHCLEDGWLLVVSDGLGSKKKSQIGSSAVCEAVWACACKNDTDIIFQYPEQFMTQVHKEWLLKLNGETVDDCCATVLILLVVQDRAIALQIGDGFISVLADDKPYILFDDKSEHYINETDCFQEYFDPSLTRYKTISFDYFQCALMCSDGVEIGDMTEQEIEDFTKSFYNSFFDMSPGEVKCNVKKWLSDWPGSDDKTAAYLINRGDLK